MDSHIDAYGIHNKGRYTYVLFFIDIEGFPFHFSAQILTPCAH